MEREEQWEAAHGLRAGDLAPKFRLRDAEGGWISLLQTLGAGPAVLVFIGGTCAAQTGPAGLLERQAEAAAQGAVLLTISPGGAACGLGDPDGEVRRAYGAPEGAEVAIYVIDRDGRIVLSCVEADPHGPLELGEAMAALKALRARRARGEQARGE